PVERRGATRQAPQPLEPVCEEPGRFINRVDRGMVHLGSNSQGVRLNGLGDTVEHFLNGAQADGHLQDRGTESLHQPPPVAIGPSQFTYQGTEAWAIPGGMLGRSWGGTPAAALWTPALVQDPVCHLHGDGG